MRIDLTSFRDDRTSLLESTTKVGIEETQLRIGDIEIVGSIEPLILRIERLGNKSLAKSEATSIGGKTHSPLTRL